MRSLARPPTHQPGFNDLPRWLWLLGPAAIYPLLVVAIFVYRPFFNIMTAKESGIEWLSVLVLLIGVGFGIHLLVRYRRRLPSRYLIYWLALITVGMFFLAGEEMSWGQHLNFWTGDDLPETWQEINDQRETNVHNLTNALDQGPTNLVVISVFVAFVLNPLYLKRKGQTMPPSDPGYWFWPTHVGQAAAWGVLIIPFPKRIYEWTTGQEASVAWRHSEIHEFYIALLLMLYTLSIWQRLRQYTPPRK